MTNGETLIINQTPEQIHKYLDNFLSDIDEPTRKEATKNEWKGQELPPIEQEHHTAEQIANWQKDSTQLDTLLKKWQTLFGNKNPDEVFKELKELENKQTGATLTDEEKEAIKEYQKVKSALKPWTDIFGNETAKDIKKRLDEKPMSTPSPSTPDNSSYFSHYLTNEDKKKLARYERLHFERVRDNWEEELEKLNKNKKPFDLPPTWREQLNMLEELRKRPTWEALHKAVSEEKGKYKDYDNINNTLKTWTDIFGTDTAQQVKDKLDDKPILTTLSPEEKEAITNYKKLKGDYDNLKTKTKKEIDNLKQKIRVKDADIDKLKGWKNQPAPGSLVEQIRQKVIQAYNSTDYLNGYYEKLMKQFLNWEITGTEEQKNAIATTRTEINKCLKFLEEIGTIKNPNIRI